MAVDKTLCGDYPAPCNCDDPETHDGAVERAAELPVEIDSSIINANVRRFDAIINEYKIHARHLHIIADEDSLPTANALDDYQRSSNQAMVALTLRNILTSHNHRDQVLFLVKNTVRQATSIEGVRLALDVEQSITQS